MKKSYFILIALFSFSLLQAENTKFSKSLEKFKSNIVIQPNPKANLENNQANWDIDTLITFFSFENPGERIIKKYDIKGNIVEKRSDFYHSSGTPNWSLNRLDTYTYDSQNRVLTEKFEYGSKNEQDILYEFEYDCVIDDVFYNRVIKVKNKINPYSGFVLRNTQYQTISNESGYKQIEDLWVSEGSDPDSKVITLYDDNDSIISRVQQIIDNFSEFKNRFGTFYEYDNQNRLVKKTSKNWNFSTQEEYLDDIYIYIYHHDNCLAEEHHVRNIRPSGSGGDYSQIFIDAYTYDENNTLKSTRRYWSQNDDGLVEHYSPLSHPYYSEFRTDYKVDYVFENDYLVEELRSNYYYDYYNPTEYEIEYDYRYLYEYDSKGNLLTITYQSSDLEYDEYEDKWIYTKARRTHYEYDEFGNSIYSWNEAFEGTSSGGVVSAPKKPRGLNSKGKMSAPQDDHGWENAHSTLNVIAGGKVVEGPLSGFDYYVTFVDRNNIVLTNAKEGHKGAAYFDGKTAVRTSANPPAFTNTLTMAAWVKFNTSVGNKTIASWQCSAGDMAYFRIDSSQLTFRIWEDATNSMVAVGSNKLLLADTWYHVAVTLDGGVTKLYIDGEDVTQTNEVVFDGLGSTLRFEVGASPEGFIDDMFKGYIDNLSLWSDVKTPLEIQMLFKEIVGDEDNLVLALNFDHSLSILPIDTDIRFESIELQYVMLDPYVAAFNGIDHTLTLETPAPYGNSFTISGWFKAEEGDVRTIASWADENAFNSFQLGADNKLYYIQDNNGNTQTAVSEKNIENDIWYHIALVKNNSAVKFYINGDEDASTTNNINTNQTNDNFSIGSLNQNGIATQYWKGEMDNLCFYTEARTAAQVLENFQYGVDLTTESLWAYWNFDYRNEIVVDTKNNHHIFSGSKELVKSILVYADNNMESELLRERTDHTIHIVGKGTHFYVNEDFIDNSLIVHPRNKLTTYVGIEFSPSSLILKSNEKGSATMLGAPSTRATVEQYIKNDNPLLLGVPLLNIESSTGIDKLFAYDEWVDEWYETSYISPGDGLLAHPETAANKISFTGNIHSGGFSKYCWGDMNRYELISNPYPSYITWKDILSEAKHIEESVWYSIYKNDNQVIGVYNGEVGTHGAGNTIVPFQAFWVRIQEYEDRGIIDMDNTIRSHYDEAVHDNKKLRVPQEQYPITRITVSDGTLDDETILYFKNEHSDWLDEKDAGKMMMNNDNPEIWTILYDEPYAINAMEAVPYHIEMPLGFSTNKAGNFTLRATDFTGFETGDKLILYDKEADDKATNIATKTYSFSSDAINTTDRFTIKFAPVYPTNYKDIDMSKYVAVYAKDSRIVVDIKLNMENVHAHIYNISGQKLVSEKLIANHTTLSTKLTAGVYLVVVENMKERVTKRIIIK